ncbi:hypothetical protein JCM8097_001324 [Rhodosporidiobolus ruineniae]
MCCSITSLVYGVPVRTSSLVFAVDAWPHLEPTLRFFDLVSLRLRRGTLSAAAAGQILDRAVERVPWEVWELVRHKLVDLELDEADKRFLEGDEDDELRWRDLLQQWGDPKYYWGDFIYEDFRELALFDEAREQRAKNLLDPFGLQLPPRGLLTFVENPDEWASPFAATLLTLAQPALPDYLTSTQEAMCGGDWSADEHALADISFSISSDARQRFLSLIKLLHLEPLEIEPSPPPAIKDGLEAEKEERRKRKGKGRADQPKVEERRGKFKFLPVELEDVEPRWRLHTTCEMRS